MHMKTKLTTEQIKLKFKLGPKGEIQRIYDNKTCKVTGIP